MPDEKKLDPFKPQQPRIPGISESAQAAQNHAPPSSAIPSKPDTHDGLPTVWVALIVLACFLCVGVAWRSHRSFAKEPAMPAKIEVPAAVVEPKPEPVAKLPVGPGEIATTTQLERVWSSQRFIFHDVLTSEQVPAMVVHLPNGVYWGFSLREPFGTCELEYITDMAKLRVEYHFRADHPMVGDTCNHTVFDLTKYGSGPNGLVRGEILQGSAVRPPMAIEIHTKGNQVVAVRME